jgi:hypothetical protein
MSVKLTNAQLVMMTRHECERAYCPGRVAFRLADRIG